MPLDKEASGNYRGRMQTWPRWPPVGYVTDHPRGRGHHSGLPPGGLPPKTSMTQKVSDMSTGLLGLVPKEEETIPGDLDKRCGVVETGLTYDRDRNKGTRLISFSRGKPCTWPYHNVLGMLVLLVHDTAMKQPGQD
jgi:hypothetical protein